MDLLVNGRNLEVTERLHDYVEKKTSRLDRYLPDIRDIRVDLSTENTRNAVERQVAQITVREAHGTILRAEERSNDMFAAIDAVIDKLYRQISRYRGKQRRRWRQRGLSAEQNLGEPLPLEEELEIEEDMAAIVRTKRFSLRPMTADEAIDQLELLGHDFFVFYNAEDDAVNVLYKRRDDNFGLLQPELG